MRGATIRAQLFHRCQFAFQSTRPLRGATGKRDDGVPRQAISIHAPLAGRDFDRVHVLHAIFISIHAPLAGRDRRSGRAGRDRCISIHAPLAGRDEHRVDHLVRQLDFNPRAPCGARRSSARFPSLRTDFNPRAPCGARRRGLHREEDNCYFNPRAPCGARLRRSRFAGTSGHFNPRAPCGARPSVASVASRLFHFNPRAPCGARPPVASTASTALIFQPTRPLRGATPQCLPDAVFPQYFNPRAPCGARRYLILLHGLPVTFQPTRPLRGATVAVDRSRMVLVISTHAPLAGRDISFPFMLLLYYNFNPRAPCGARRNDKLDNDIDSQISTHAPLAGRDVCLRLPIVTMTLYFNPRAPCGARPQIAHMQGVAQAFQPTRPLRGATAMSKIVADIQSISTHAPLAGRDAASRVTDAGWSHFNPRAPCGARPFTNL